MIGLLIPTGSELIGWADILFASFVFVGLGRLLSKGSSMPELGLIVGWGAFCLVLTFWGAFTPVGMRFPAITLAAIGLAGFVAGVLRWPAQEWGGIGRLTALSLPLLAVLASAVPSLPDTFLNLLPNAAYLFDHGTFPGDARPPSYSFLPGAPYNLQFASFLAGVISPVFPANALIAFNLILQLGFALFLARIIAGRGNFGWPSWLAMAIALLLTFALNPGFVPRYDLSGYGEASVTVATAFGAWLLARGNGDRGPAVMAAGVLAALVNIKQDSIAIVLGLILCALAIALLGPRAERRIAIGGVVLAAVPAFAIYGAWRWYALTHFAAGELKPLPFAQWHFGELVSILGSIGRAIFEKPYFFLCLAAAFIATILRLRTQGWNAATRVGFMLCGTFLVYNAALLYAYIAHFPETMSSQAHSYFRYNTHLGLLLVLALVLLSRDAAEARIARLNSVFQRIGAGVVIAAALLVPFAFLHVVRFDLEQPELRASRIASNAAAEIGDRDRVALLLPGDNGSLATVLETELRDFAPRHPDVTVKALRVLGPDTLRDLAEENYDIALLSCALQPILGVSPGQGAILRRSGNEWNIVRTWSYEVPGPRERWSHVIAEAPLCL
jgi:hypothetical protein